MRMGAFFEQRASDGEAVAVRPTEAQATFAEPGAIPLEERKDEVMDAGLLRGAFHLGLRGSRPGQKHVVPHCAVEQKRVLPHHPDARAEVPDVVFRQLAPVDPYLALGVDPEAKQQVGQRGLTCPARPDDGHPLAFVNAETEPLQRAARRRKPAKRETLDDDLGFCVAAVRLGRANG
jgi:hypothetical protein